MRFEPYYWSLRRHLIYIIVLVSFTPLLVLTTTGLLQFYSAYQGKVMARLHEVMLRHSQGINVFLHQKLSEIQVMADIVSPAELFQEQSGLLDDLLQSLQRRHEGVFVDLALVDDQGRQVGYAGPFGAAQTDHGSSRWFQEAMRRKYYISNVFLDPRGLPQITVAVKQTWQGQDWILRSTIDFVTFNQLVERIRIGQTGFAYIINKRGEFQSYPRTQPQEIGFILEMAGRQQGEGLEGAEQQTVGSRHLAQNVRSMVRDEPSTGEKTIYVTSPLKNGVRIMVFQQDFADAFSPFLRYVYMSLGVMTIAGIVILTMAMVLSRRVVLRIVRSDQEKEMMNEQVIEAGKMASLGKLAAGIAHEINNPVAIMVEEAGWIQDLTEEKVFRDEADRQEIDRALKQIRTQGNRCKQITHKLLSFARKTDPTTKPVDINELVGEMAGLSEQHARFANVQIVKDFDPEVPSIPASPSELQQVILNLINNAIDAMEKSGGKLTLSTRKEDEYALISVADTGEGIPKQILQRIFDPFFSTKQVGKGTGLGLSICYGIVQKMGGVISVNSSVGVGTTFHVRLPIRPGGGSSKTKET